eukprot:gene21256-25542_t
MALDYAELVPSQNEGVIEMLRMAMVAPAGCGASQGLPLQHAAEGSGARGKGEGEAASILRQLRDAGFTDDAQNLQMI